jgi:plastocyanin
MSKKFAAVGVALAAVVLAACSAHYGGSSAGTSSFTPPNAPELIITAQLPDGKTGTIMEELPGEGLGTIKDPNWDATLGGYTQQQFSQALGFPPGTKLTIKNISKSIHHTFNVVAKIKKPPANFPSNPSLSQNPSGGDLQKGFASGVINPGSSVTVTAKKAGIYLFGCAFHYHSGMQDVIVIAKGATPGPQATAPAR